MYDIGTIINRNDDGEKRTRTFHFKALYVELVFPF